MVGDVVGGVGMRFEIEKLPLREPRSFPLWAAIDFYREILRQFYKQR